uniref:Uncharacterized protein n=1 Tax=Parascaris univalens TaxID=6257 RepID=A0A914ZVS7_PARUN
MAEAAISIDLLSKEAAVAPGDYQPKQKISSMCKRTFLQAIPIIGIPNVHSSTTSGLPSSSLNSSLKAQRSSINEAGRCISSTMNRSSGESQNRSSNETAADDTQLRGNVHAIDHFTVVRSFEECIRYLNMSHFSLK